ncbi:transcription factor ILR3-like isoform X2 [Durio zibethinus]|uniref:Transcription factor ILR3-like isoform X2 n=1 Tax=Durio zibethinus TaxID=66656 RepID=A0A6P5Y5W3_DURZI|nr:transcription factor ILR3-like isoform X2 [Durio zibethinus]
MVSPDNSNYWSHFDYQTLIDDIPVSDGLYSGFSWSTQPINASSNVVRVRSESCNPSSSKACREKLRRDRLNDKFTELGSILEPGRPPKTDKATILIDAVRMVAQLRGEAQKLKDSNSSLQERIKELKAEKNELRDEKQRLKAEKEKLEQQLKAMNPQPSFMPPTPAIPAAFAAAQGQAPGNKLVPFIGYPGVAMWQFMPPAAMDTSQDHILRPPVA